MKKYHNYKSLALSGIYYNPIDESATKHIKEAIISLATFGPGNNYVKMNQEALDIFEGFQTVLPVSYTHLGRYRGSRMTTTGSSGSSA